MAFISKEAENGLAKDWWEQNGLTGDGFLAGDQNYPGGSGSFNEKPFIDTNTGQGVGGGNYDDLDLTQQGPDHGYSVGPDGSAWANTIAGPRQIAPAGTYGSDGKVIRNGGGQPGGLGGGQSQGGQNYQQIVESLMGGSNDPNKLRQIAPELAKYGIQLSNANAEGELSKIILPDGTPVRVIGSGEQHAVWNPQPGNWGPGGVPLGGQPGQGGSQQNLSNPNDLTAGWTQAFQAPPGAPGADPFTDQFSAPTIDEARNFPGYQFALKEGLQGIERGAAAKGTLLTGGTLKDSMGFATGLADQTYQNLYNNKRGEFADKFNIHTSNAANASSAYGSSYDRAMGEYLTARNIFDTNQGNLFNRLSSVSGQGLSAAGGQAGAASNIGQAGANAATGAGNATAAGDITKGNANAGIATTIGQLGSSFLNPEIYGGTNKPGVYF